jgi:hypothetical protein
MPTFEYPLAAPTLSGTVISVDLMLQEPTRVTRYISDTDADELLRGTASSPTPAECLAARCSTTSSPRTICSRRDVAERGAGRGVPDRHVRPSSRAGAGREVRWKVLRVTDEARDRNNLTAIASEASKLGNDIRDQLHTRALAELDANIAAIGSDVQVTGTSWADAAALTLTTTANNLLPATDFAELNKRAANQRLGTMYNLWIVNPQEAMNFDIIYGGNAATVLARYGVDMIATPLVAAGTAYAVQEGRVGQVRYEQPLQTTTTREELKEATWVKSSVRSVYAVTNPYNAVKITGLAA